MKEDEIRRLVKIVEESNIGEIEITQSRWGKRTIKISRTLAANSHFTNSSPPQTIQASTSPQPSVSDDSAKEPAETKSDSARSSSAVEIKSPMVGTLYRAPAPDADPYVDVGKTVKKGQVLCIIEAMKLMNEIEAELDGTIVEILAENGQPVEYNQPLFLIEPA